MTPYNQSVEAAQMWKSSVERLWKTQRSVLIFGAIGTILLVIAMILLFCGFALASDGSQWSVAMITIFVLFAIAGFGFSIVAYVKQWVFYFDLKRWGESSPMPIAESVRVLAICTLVSLILTIISPVFQNVSIVVIFGIISSFVSMAIFVVEIVKFVMYIKLRTADAMPAVAKQGATSIMISYIVNIACTIVGVIFVVSAAVTSFVVEDIDSGYAFIDDDYYDDDYVEYYDDVLDYDDVEEMTLLSGIVDGDIMSMSDEEFDGLIDSFTDSVAVVVLLLIGLVISLGGVIARVVLYYRGWWLISKSELPVLPESVESEECSAIY